MGRLGDGSLLCAFAIADAFWGTSADLGCLGEAFEFSLADRSKEAGQRGKVNRRVPKLPHVFFMIGGKGSFPYLVPPIDLLCVDRLKPLRDFLNFLDRLELQFYNAAQGTALGVIPLAPKPTIVFARSNKRMWDEWFTRVRRRTIEGAKATDEHELLIRHGYMVRRGDSHTISFTIRN